MGYDAFVLCNCYKEGKTPAPPYFDCVKIDDYGPYLDLESMSTTEGKEFLQQQEAFESWQKNACPHEDMELVSVHLSNIAGMRAFKALLKECGGAERFPVLSSYLPVANGGTLPAQHAAQAMSELCSLEKEGSLEERVVLKLKETAQRVQSAKANGSHIFTFSKSTEQYYGIDGDGFFIMKRRKVFWIPYTTLVFRSTDFKQTAIGTSKFLFTDKKSNHQGIGNLSLYPAEKNNALEEHEFVVVKETTTVSTEYRYILEPLKRLTQASIDSGNPIVWT
jgi:hypothetical protein